MKKLVWKFVNSTAFLYLYSLSVVFLLILNFTACSDKEERNDEKYKTASTYSGNITISDVSPTYWYVYFNLGKEKSGFAILTINKPYFSLIDAVEKIEIRYPDETYIGIVNAFQVSEKCYKEYYNK